MNEKENCFPADRTDHAFRHAAGCGGGGTSDQGAASASQPQETAQSAPTQAPDPASTPDEASTPDDSAAETTSDRPEVTYPLVEEETTLTYWQSWPPFLSEISEPSDAAMFEKLAEVTGVKLEISAVSTETAADDFMLRCASVISPTWCRTLPFSTPAAVQRPLRTMSSWICCP